MASPHVSIVTPSYNQGPFIKATIDSVLTQDYNPLELIVIDGASTDETVDILRRYDDPRLFWVSEPDSGQANAINKGLRRARGAILSYINSDDVLLPGAVSFAVNYLDNHPDADAVYGDCRLIDAGGNAIGVDRSRPFDLRQLKFKQTGTFWRRSVTEAIGFFDESYHYTMDTEYWWRMAIYGYTPHYVPGIRAAYRLHESSKTVSQEAGFIQDYKRLLDAVYARSALPAPVREAKDAAYTYLDWRKVKMAWLEKDYTTARPKLRRFMRGRKWERRLLALAMYIDSYLHTPFARFIAFLYAKRTGVQILGH